MHGSVTEGTNSGIVGEKMAKGVRKSMNYDSLGSEKGPGEAQAEEDGDEPGVTGMSGLRREVRDMAKLTEEQR